MSSSRIHTPQLEDIPELIHRIQSFLPARNAARTCILSKSWLHAWSTIPTLRFPPLLTDEEERKYKKVVDHTLQRYHRDNISIESLDLQLCIQNQGSAIVAEKWIQPIVSKSCLKEFSLKIWGLNDSFTLPNELFSSENLNTIKVKAQKGTYLGSYPFIKCVTLRVLDLEYVNITEEVLHNLLSTCTLLEKIKLWHCEGLKNVIVKSLRHLRELVIRSVLLEINDVPSLRLLDYNAPYLGWRNPVPFKMDSLGSVIELSLDGVTVDDAEKGTYMGSNRIIKCGTLRVLDLQNVNISEEVLHDLLSTCTLLEKVKLWGCRGLKNVMVKNLRRLRELVITSVLSEINDVSSLRLLNYDARFMGRKNPVPFKMDSLGSVTQLSIKGVIVDDTFLDIIKSKFPLLECLTLQIKYCGLESLVITSASLKTLTLYIWEDDSQVNVQVYAPKLLSFTYNGEVHGLLFPTIAPRHINLDYLSSRPLDHLFFLKLIDVLNSSSKFYIYIDSPGGPSNIDVDDLRRRCSFPVPNVHSLVLRESAKVNIRFFEAFFSICHPRYIISTNLVVREMMERPQPTDLKYVKLKNPRNGKWETLTSSLTSVLDTLTDSDQVECKLNWVSP